MCQFINMKQQVNVTDYVDGRREYWISEYSADGYSGALVDTVYKDGCDTTNWRVFVGTEEECQQYISLAERDERLAEKYAKHRQEDAGLQFQLNVNEYDLTLWGQWAQSKYHTHDWTMFKTFVNRETFQRYILRRQRKLLDEGLWYGHSHYIEVRPGRPNMQQYKNFLAQQGFELLRQYDEEITKRNFLGV